MQHDPGPIPPPPPWQPAAGGEVLVGSVSTEAAIAADSRASEDSRSVLDSHQESWRRESLQRELAATREELAAMRALLEELPAIFEGRFASRLEPLLGQRQRLQAETAQLREQLLALQPASGTTAALPPAEQRSQAAA